MTVTNMKKLEAAHHKWQRKIMGISWKDKIRNEEVRRRTGQERLEDIIRQRRLRWLGHLHRMNEQHISRQAMYWMPPIGKKKRGRPRKKRRDAINSDLEVINVSWDEASQLAADRLKWKSCIARCASSTRKD